MNHKNRKPKRVKGCCTICSCKSHDAGLRTKRKRTLQELRARDAMEDRCDSRI